MKVLLLTMETLEDRAAYHPRSLRGLVLRGYRNDVVEIPDDTPKNRVAMELQRFATAKSPYVLFVRFDEPDTAYELASRYTSARVRTKALKLWSHGDLDLSMELRAQSVVREVDEETL